MAIAVGQRMGLFPGLHRDFSRPAAGFFIPKPKCRGRGRSRFFADIVYHVSAVLPGANQADAVFRHQLRRLLFHQMEGFPLTAENHRRQLPPGIFPEHRQHRRLGVIRPRRGINLLRRFRNHRFRPPGFRIKSVHHRAVCLSAFQQICQQCRYHTAGLPIQPGFRVLGAADKPRPHLAVEQVFRHNVLCIFRHTGAHPPALSAVDAMRLHLRREKSRRAFRHGNRPHRAHRHAAAAAGAQQIPAD